MWEIGRSNPEYATLVEIATYFNVSTDYLLGMTDFKNNREAANLDEKFQQFIEGKTKFEIYESEMVFDINKFILSAIDFYREDQEFCLSFLSLVRELSESFYYVSAQTHLSIIEKDKFDKYSESQIKKYIALVMARMGLMEKGSIEHVEKIYNLFSYKLNESIPHKYVPSGIEVEVEELHKLFKEQLKL